jgi:GT2 family glycosyltransferase
MRSSSRPRTSKKAQSSFDSRHVPLWHLGHPLFHNRTVGRSISVIIPNYNGGATIGRCLDAVFSSQYDDFEAIVVDDCSTDDSVGLIARYPCRLIRLETHAGAGRARNIGAAAGKGEILFFIDADCVVLPDTLSAVDGGVPEDGRSVVGGTYTALPYDNDFYSVFQSVFIHYSETKKPEPDYIASHAMAMRRSVFERTGGFPEKFMPILEDVEYSHRLRRAGYRLVSHPSILVRHIFRFTLGRSLRNAYRKARYWTMYSMKNRDIFADSGTASIELKTAVFSCFLCSLLAVVFVASGSVASLAAIPAVLAADLVVSRRLLMTFFRAKGFAFLAGAAFYYTAVYPYAVGAGSCAGMLAHLFSQAEGEA